MRFSTRSGFFALLAGRLVIVACLLPVHPSLGQGTIAYHQPPTPLGYGPVPGFTMVPLDLNGDGLEDFTFDSSLLQSVQVVPARDNRILILPESPPDLGGYVQPLGDGTPISSEAAQGGLIWADADAPASGGALLSACAAPFGCVGPWVNLTAFAGVEFEINGDTHYGWVRISNFDLGGNVLDWAYETRANTPILAGAVPEPSVWALLFGGGVLMVWFRRKRNERRG